MRSKCRGYHSLSRRRSVSDTIRFTRGKCCIIRKSLVNKGLAMLQMLVAKSGHEKDHHAASALPFLRQAQLAFPPRPLKLMQYRLSVAVVARAGLCAFQARMKPLPHCRSMSLEIRLRPRPDGRPDPCPAT